MEASAKEVPAYVCSHVFDQQRPVLLAVRSDGDWQFLCGGNHDDAEVPRVIGLNHLLDADPTLRALLELPMDWQAERTANGEQWEMSPLPVG